MTFLTHGHRVAARSEVELLNQFHFDHAYRTGYPQPLGHRARENHVAANLGIIRRAVYLEARRRR